MKDVTADKAKKISQKQSKAHKSSDDNIALHHRYGRIGISAVAAAVRYQGGPRIRLTPRQGRSGVRPLARRLLRAASQPA